jgi:hypothetical protein
VRQVLLSSQTRCVEHFSQFPFEQVAFKIASNSIAASTALWIAWHELIAICAKLGATIGDQQPPPLATPNPYTYGSGHQGCGRSQDASQRGWKRA